MVWEIIFFCFPPFLSFIVYFKVDINIAKDGSDNTGIKTERKLEFSTGKPAKTTPQGIFQLLNFSNIFMLKATILPPLNFHLFFSHCKVIVIKRVAFNYGKKVWKRTFLPHENSYLQLV